MVILIWFGQGFFVLFFVCNCVDPLISYWFFSFVRIGLPPLVLLQILEILTYFATNHLPVANIFTIMLEIIHLLPTPTLRASRCPNPTQFWNGHLQFDNLIWFLNCGSLQSFNFFFLSSFIWLPQSCIPPLCEVSPFIIFTTVSSDCWHGFFFHLL